MIHSKLGISIITLITIIIIVVTVFFLLPHEEDIQQIDTKIVEFLNTPGLRKLKTLIDKKTFEELPINVGLVLYYFPENCPKYNDDILLVEDTKDGARYFLPETQCLIKMPKEHKWTQEPTDLVYWKITGPEPLVTDGE